MNNMESLHNEFEKYFKDNQEKINYFLDVLKNVKEDRWEYSDNFSNITEEELKFISKIKSLKYDNIDIRYEFDDDYCVDVWGDGIGENIIRIYVDGMVIFETDDESELSIEILALIERAEKRVKKEEK